MIFWLVLAVLVATIFAVGAFLRAPFDVLLILCVAAFAVALAVLRLTATRRE